MVSSKGKERASSDSEDDEMNGTSSSVRPTNGGGGTQYNQSEEMTQEQHMQRTKDTRAGYRKLEADVAGESCALIELVRGGGATGGNTGEMLQEALTACSVAVAWWGICAEGVDSKGPKKNASCSTRWTKMLVGLVWGQHS